MLDSSGMREKLFTMRMSDDEAHRLDAVASHYSLNAAGLLRMLVKREYDALVAPKPVDAIINENLRKNPQGQLKKKTKR